MNKTQRENLAKYSYDISKLLFAAFVLANIMSDKFYIYLVIIGIFGTMFFIILGYILNQKE